MKIGTIEIFKFPPYKRGRNTLNQVIYKTFLGTINGKPRWGSQTRHERIG